MKHADFCKLVISSINKFGNNSKAIRNILTECEFKGYNGYNYHDIDEVNDYITNHLEIEVGTEGIISTDDIRDYIDDEIQFISDNDGYKAAKIAEQNVEIDDNVDFHCVCTYDTENFYCSPYTDAMIIDIDDFKTYFNISEDEYIYLNKN